MTQITAVAANIINSTIVHNVITFVSHTCITIAALSAIQLIAFSFGLCLIIGVGYWLVHRAHVVKVTNPEQAKVLPPMLKEREAATGVETSSSLKSDEGVVAATEVVTSLPLMPNESEVPATGVETSSTQMIAKEQVIDDLIAMVRKDLPHDMQKLIEKEIIPNLIPVLNSVMPALLSHDYMPNQSQFEELILEIKKVINREILQQICTEQHWEFSQTEELLELPQFAAIASGRVVIDEQIKTQIIAKVKLLQKVDALQQALDQAVLPIDEEAIRASRYGCVKNLMQKHIPDADAQYRHFLNRALVNRQIRNPMLFLKEAKLEKLVFKGLGFDVSKYPTKTYMEEKMKMVLEYDVSKACQGASLEEIKKLIDYRTFYEKCIAMEVPAEQIQKLYELMIFIKEQHKELTEEGEKIPVPQCIEDIAEESIRNYYRRRFVKRKDTVVLSMLQTYIESLQGEGSNWYPMFLKMQKIPILAEVFEGASQELTREMNAELTSRDKYKDNLTIPFIQNQGGDQDVFLAGVCFAICQRFAKNVMQRPDADDVSVAITHTNPVDRVVQAAYSVEKRSISVDTMNLIPPKFLGDYEHKLLFLCDPKDLKDNIKASLVDLDQVEGVFNIWTEDHAMILQIDRKRNVYRFFDPNFGLYRFQANSVDEGIEQVVTAFKELTKGYPVKEYLTFKLQKKF